MTSIAFGSSTFGIYTLAETFLAFLQVIDLNDYKHKLTTRKGRPVRNKLYRHYCNGCAKVEVQNAC